MKAILLVVCMFALPPKGYAQSENPAASREAIKEVSQEFKLRVMSYNLYRGGTMRGHPSSQTAKAILEAKADIVGVQETQSPKGHTLVQETQSPKGHTLEPLAELLDWNHSTSTRCPILTRYEIVQELENGIQVKLPSGQEVYVFNLHLPSSPYQPYQLY